MKIGPEYCMFCDANPCKCQQSPQKSTTRKSLPKARPAGLVTGKQVAPPVTSPRRGLDTHISEDELDYRSCVRALDSILAPESRIEVAHILNTPPSLEERIYDWKKTYKVERERHGNDGWTASREASEDGTG